MPAERLCPGDQLYPDCPSACVPCCSRVGEGGEGTCGECLRSAIARPPGLFWDGAPCSACLSVSLLLRRQRYAPGDTVRQLCNPRWVPQVWLALSLGLETARSTLIPPMCNLLNLLFLLGTSHKWPAPSHGISGGPG